MPTAGADLRFLLGFLLVMALGVLVRRSFVGGGRSSGAGLLAGAALAGAIGLAVAVPVAVVAGLGGLPLTGRGVGGLLVGLCALAGAAAGLRHRRGGRARSAAVPRRRPEPAGEPGAPAATTAFAARALVAGRVVLAAALVLLLAKIALAPLWSWDHFATWGIKARRLAAQDSLDLAFLARPELWATVPDYPLGVPVGWLLLTLGAVPRAAAFQAAHALAALGLVLLVRRGAAGLAGSAAVGDAAGALVAVSPVAWDTESLGLADLPFAFVAVAAVVALRLAVPGAPGPGSGAGSAEAPGGTVESRAGAWSALAGAGLLAGFLPWVKAEGLPLAVLLAGVAAVWLWSADARLPRPASVRRRGLPPPARAWIAFAAPAALLAAAALRVGTLLPPGRSFFEGDWAGRVAKRFPERAPEILALLARDLLHPAWLGLWIAFAAGLAAAWRRPRRALPLFLLVTVQLAIYAGVFFASYVDPPDHVRSAWFRIAAAQAPLAVLALAALAGPRERSETGAGGPAGQGRAEEA